MPWFHTQWGTYGSWLPGDERGFRSRDHRIHSTGSYKDPPPPTEHAGLRRYAGQIMRGEPVELDPMQRQRALDAIVEKILREQMHVLCVSVSNAHVHCIAECSLAVVKSEMGKLKRHSSLRLGDELPGAVWSAGCYPVPIRHPDHLLNAYRYVMAHVHEGAAVHSFREPGS